MCVYLVFLHFQVKQRFAQASMSPWLIVLGRNMNWADLCCWEQHAGRTRGWVHLSPASRYHTMCLRSAFHHEIKRHCKGMFFTYWCEIPTFEWREAFERHQPASSSCPRDLMLLWEHLHKSIFVAYIASPKLLITRSCQLKLAEGLWREEVGLNLFKMMVQSWKKKTARCQSSVVSPSAFQHITSQLYTLPSPPSPYRHLTGTECKRETLG